MPAACRNCEGERIYVHALVGVLPKVKCCLKLGVLTLKLVVVLL